MRIYKWPDDASEPWEESPDPLCPDPAPVEPSFEGSEALQAKLRELYHEFQDVSSADLRPTPAKVTPMTLDVDGKVWKRNNNRTPPRQQSPAKNEAVRAQVWDRLEKKEIQPSNAAYYSQVLLVPTPDGPWRFCIVFRSLITATAF